jgi:hypothetical protein
LPTFFDETTTRPPTGAIDLKNGKAVMYRESHAKETISFEPSAFEMGLSSQRERLSAIGYEFP